MAFPGKTLRSHDFWAPARPCEHRALLGLEVGMQSRVSEMREVKDNHSFNVFEGDRVQ